MKSLKRKMTNNESTKEATKPMAILRLENLSLIKILSNNRNKYVLARCKAKLYRSV